METYNYLPNWLIQNILKNFKILLKYIESISIMFQNKSVNQKTIILFKKFLFPLQIWKNEDTMLYAKRKIQIKKEKKND